jgi:hypothetical protein
VTCTSLTVWQCGVMITLDEKIARTQKMIRRLEEDQPYMRVRLSMLGEESRQSATAFAERVLTEAEAELQRLMAERRAS